MKRTENELLISYLHEIAHKNGKEHGEAETFADYMGSEYYKFIESTDGAKSCVSR